MKRDSAAVSEADRCQGCGHAASFLRIGSRMRLSVF